MHPVVVHASEILEIESTQKEVEVVKAGEVEKEEDEEEEEEGNVFDSLEKNVLAQREASFDCAPATFETQVKA